MSSSSTSSSSHSSVNAVPPSPRISARGPTPPASPAFTTHQRHLPTTPTSSTTSLSSSSNASSASSSSSSTAYQQQQYASSSTFGSEVEIPFTVRPGDKIANRYEVLCLIGRGTFSSVYGCRVLTPFAHLAFGIHHTNPYIPHNIDISNRDQIVAMKVVRDVERYRKAAEREIALLELMKKQPMLSTGCVELVDYFLWSNRYVCMVFPLHGSSLYDFLYRNHFLPFFPSQLQQISKQILQTLANLQDLNIIHADLKPENILFVDSAYDSVPIGSMNVHVPQTVSIKFIDFGTAVLNSNIHKPKVVASRSYRPPEVIFESGWSFAVDVWSAGCILYELYTGIRLFNLTHTCTDMDHLRMMETVLGPIPTHLKAKSPIYANQSIIPFDVDATNLTCPAVSPAPSTYHNLSFNMNSTMLLAMASQYQQQQAEQDQQLQRKPSATPSTSKRTSTISVASSTSSSSSSSSSPSTSFSLLSHPSSSSPSPDKYSLRMLDRITKEDALFGDLLCKLLNYDQHERISAKQALLHPFFQS